MTSCVPVAVQPERAVRVRVQTPDPEARAWCGTLLSAHSSKCVDCRDRELERVVAEMGGVDVSTYRPGKVPPRKAYQYAPCDRLQSLGFVCTWFPKTSLTAALLDYIRGYRDWCNRMLGEVQA